MRMLLSHRLKTVSNGKETIVRVCSDFIDMGKKKNEKRKERKTDKEKWGMGGSKSCYVDVFNGNTKRLCSPISKRIHLHVGK